jgi:hypothetical protein
MAQKARQEEHRQGVGEDEHHRGDHAEGDRGEYRHAPAGLVRQPPEKEGGGERTAKIDGLDQRERDLGEVELVTIDDVERRRQRGAHEREHEHGGRGQARSVAAKLGPVCTENFIRID